MRGSGRDQRLDLIKGLAIAAVVLQHALSPAVQHAIWSSLHIRQAVPVFITMSAMSWAKGLNGVAGMYPSGWWRRWWKRLGLPFVVVFFLSGAVALLKWYLAGTEPYIGPLTLIGHLPFGGPGNYYVSLLLQLVVLCPFLYRVFRMSPRWFFLGAVIVDFAFEFACGAVPIDSYLYAAALPRFMVAVALGFALSERETWPRLPRRAALAVAVAFAYLVAFEALGWRIAQFRLDWQPENLVAAAYAAGLISLGLVTLPTERVPAAAWIAEMGRASYHIFLVQMLYFSFWPRFGRLSLLPDLVIPIVLGWLAFVVDSRLRTTTSHTAVTSAEATT